MAFNGFTISLYNFITACHGIPKFIQPLPLNFFYFIHLISQYTNVLVVEISTALI